MFNKARITSLIIIIGSLMAISFLTIDEEDWGFFGHRRINRMAVFTLPPDMIPLFKGEIEYLTSHAVDPDKRRYATKHEAVRHYIDIDNWGEAPYDNLPRSYFPALFKFSIFFLIGENSDSTAITAIPDSTKWDDIEEVTFLIPNMRIEMGRDSAVSFFNRMIGPQLYEDSWIIAIDSFERFIGKKLPDRYQHIYVKERLSEHGINPYYLKTMQNRLTNAFRENDWQNVIRLSADFGHYIGDAHVPLHTTTNYNGQLTNQLGIHAFWESRIPELFADGTYDYLVGKAEYIENPRDYFWDIVLSSNELVDSVLNIEKRLSIEFPKDQQYCFTDRLNVNIRTQCPAYAKAYQDEMKGMVEDRMREAIKAIGSAWMTAWIDAGQPPVPNAVSFSDRDLKVLKALDQTYREGSQKGRVHQNE